MTEYPVIGSPVSKIAMKTLAALFLLITATAAAQAPSQPAAPARPRGNMLISRAVPDPAAVERGQKVFSANCSFCHGSNAQGGDSGPDLVRSELALDDDRGDKIGPVILQGRPGKGMPAFHLPPDQILDIAAFLRARQQAAIDRNAYTILNVVTGDPEKGREYFSEHCSKCHSPAGDLAGVGKKYDPVALQSRFLYPRPRPGDSHPVESKVTVTLPTGQTYSGTLEYLDDFDVALRDAAGDYHSFSREGRLKVEVHDPLAAHAELLKKYSDADMHNILAYLVTLK
ncbi:MAG TPA: c-type cytochrome [Bryobacteraceae bacterium]|nr:c-type cytochrome [Bryobacteraceae bacterium]